MTDYTSKLSRKNIKKLVPYQSARRIGGNHGDILLNANESPISVLFSLKKKSFNRYPECQPENLISSYSNYANVSYDQVLVTRGADEGIELLVKSFCEPGKDVIIYCPPTYDMYRINAEIYNIETREIPTIQNTWQLDVLNITLNLNKVKLIYICNPNNPTGNVLKKEDLIYLLERTASKALIIIDEAYIEFSLQDSMVNYIEKYPNLVILRTLSKAFALAGIRCGFILAQKNIIDILKKVISPYPISIPVTDIAVQSLEKDYLTLMYNRVIEINNNRLWLTQKLHNLPCVEKIFSSNANYILVKFFMCEDIFKTLWNNGVILRMQNTKIHLERCIRISIGTHLESLRLIQELENFSKKILF